MEHSELIGEKIYGSKFEKRDYLEFAPMMEEHIGEIGEITEVEKLTYKVSFKYSKWWYPIDEVEQYLVESYKERETVDICNDIIYLIKDVMCHENR